MLKPSFAFIAGSALAALSWLCLSASLSISSRLRSAVWNGTTIAVPAFLGLACGLLTASLFHRALSAKTEAKA